MKKIVLTMTLLISIASQAAKLLDCNISDGDTTQATVTQNGTKLSLNELTVTGHSFSRALSPAEWNAKRIYLTTKSSSAKSVLYFSQGQWWFQYTDGSYKAMGQAICN